MKIETLALLLLSAATASASTSTSGEDETLVTARKQREALVNVPLSASVIDAEALRDAGILTVRGAAARIPNVMFSEFSSRRLSFPFVRGIGSGINDPAVITYVDDVPQFGFGGTNLPLVAVDRVEFLRGPQGTLYGRNALGGLIHVRGRRPTSVRYLDFSAGFGSNNLREYAGSYSGPLGAEMLADVAVSFSERDGFTENDFTGNTVDDREAFFGRARLLWNPTESSELDFTVFGERARDGGFVLSELDGLRADSHHINQDFEGLADRDVVNPALVWRAFGDEVDFTSVSSWQSWDVLEISDFDFSTIDGVRRRSEEEQSYLYQEFRLGTGEDLGEGETRWLVGAAAFTANAERQALNNFRPGGAGILFPPASVGLDLADGQFDDTGMAFFGEVGVPLGAALELDLGLRYDRERREVERVRTFDPGSGPIVLDQVDTSETFDEVLPMAGLSWNVSADSMAYVRAAKGFKAGGFNLTSPAGSEEFEPESAWTYELGWRSEFDDGRSSLGATAFYVDWEDMQLALFDAGSGGYVANVGESMSMGIELEGRTELLEGLDGYASFGLLDSEFDEYTDAFGDNAGNELPFAPDSTWALGMLYAGSLPSGARWTLAGDYSHTGDFFYDAGNREGDNFGLASFRLGVDGRSFGFSVWVRNAFDEEYQVVAFQPSPFAPDTFVGESGAPRVLGFTLSLHL
jgi:iron complex outermembrane receptor protein